MTPPDGFAADRQPYADGVLQHLADIGAGRCSITDADLAAAPTDVAREMLVGLLTLHEDLQYERGLRAQAEQHSERLVADLRAAVTARDEFLSVASHELRTPLSTLRLQATLLARWLAQASLGEHEAALRMHFGVIERQAKRLEKLTAELLDVTRMTSGRFELHRETMDLVTLTQEIVARYRGERIGESPDVALDSDPSAIGEWDPFRLDQVISNLLVNAIRYGAGKPILVTVRCVGAVARVVVEDQGIGIAEDQKERIFGQFERAVSSQHYGGLGLGLWIVKQVVEAHRGTVTVDSTLGQGSTFTVTLPLAASRLGEQA